MNAMQYSWGSLTRLAQDRQKWRDFVATLNTTVPDEDYDDDENGRDYGYNNYCDLRKCNVSPCKLLPGAAAPNKRATIDAAGCGKRPLLPDNGESELGASQARIVGGIESVPYTWPSIVCRKKWRSLSLLPPPLSSFFFLPFLSLSHTHILDWLLSLSLTKCNVTCHVA